MDRKKLLAKQTLDCNGQLYLGMFTPAENRIYLHFHDFFEIIFVVKGRVRHIVNGCDQIIEEGQIVFVRANDYHRLEAIGKEKYTFWNIAFSSDVFDNHIQLLELYSLKSRLLKMKLPPKKILNISDLDILKMHINRLNDVYMSNKELWKIEIKVLISHLLSKFFDVKEALDSTMPLWFSEMCEHVKHRNNFRQGVDIYTEISGKSYQHIWRMFKEYKGITPIDYLNRIRLNYVAGQLVFTDRDILDICYDTGFESLSHLYRVFKKRYGMPPIMFKEKNRSASIN